MKNKRWILLLFLGAAAAFLFFTMNPQKQHENGISTSINKNAESITIKEDSGNSFELSIEDLPVYKAYLDAEENRGVEIQRTRYRVLDFSDQEKYVLLQYGCGNKQCNTLLIKKSPEIVESLSLADGIFMDCKLAADKSRVLMRYGFNEGSEVIRHIIMAIDLEKLKNIDSEPLAEDYMNTPTWPIVDYDWIDPEHFTITTADLSSSEFHYIQAWYSSPDQMKKDIRISLTKDSSSAVLAF